MTLKEKFLNLKDGDVTIVASNNKRYSGSVVTLKTSGKMLYFAIPTHLEIIDYIQ